MSEEECVQYVQLECNFCKNKRAARIHRPRVIKKGEVVQYHCGKCHVARHMIVLTVFKENAR